MADRPVLFSAPMVRGLIREVRHPGTGKTQTRRALKKSAALNALSVFGPKFLLLPGNIDLVGYAPGDRLWVRETWQGLSFGDYLPTRHCPCDLRYYATDSCADLNTDTRGYPWRPSIHMPRWASRLTLTVTDVCVERLQDISEADAIAEGVDQLFDLETIKRHPECNLSPMPFLNYLWHGHVGKTITKAQSDKWPHQYSSYKHATQSFASLWESLNGPGAWDENPWIVALTFDVAERNIDNG